jgi:hypothetical protein
VDYSGKRISMTKCNMDIEIISSYRPFYPRFMGSIPAEVSG